MLSLSARKQFGMVLDPFTDDVTNSLDVFLTDSGQFAAEYLYQVGKAGGMLAILGDSGSGKTTIRRYAIDRIKNEGHKIKIITPRCIDKERLNASMICDAIILDCSNENPKRSLEGKSRQIERILTNSSRSGWSHILMIEEAHDLTTQTLKYLKRFWELEDGFKKLLAIVLIGQTEMRAKLDESKNFCAREVIRRMEVLELEPLANAKEIASYLDLKFKRHGKERSKIISDDACEALVRKLCKQSYTGGQVYSVAYPLNINNRVREAMNIAAEMGASCVDADVLNSL